MALHGIDPKKVTPMVDSPLNRLVFAINHYVSTGDHIGVAIAAKYGERIGVTIPVRKNAPQDVADFEAFRSRFEELAPVHGASLGWIGEHEGVEAWLVLIGMEQMEAFAAELRERPGPLGWGSGKATIDAYRWEPGA